MKIKFRLWDYAYHQWDVPTVIEIDDSGQIDRVIGYGDTYNAERIEIMQFSGVTDTAGKEIYEGDIVTFDTTCGNAGNYVVKLDKGTFKPLDEMTLAISHNLKVIGNMYENSELVEGGQDE